MTSPEILPGWREKLGVGADAPTSVLMAAIDLQNARSCARLGLPADTPPAQIRATEQAVPAARAEALKAYRPRVAAASTATAPQAAPQMPMLRTAEGGTVPFPDYPQPQDRARNTSQSIDWDAMADGSEGDTL